MKRLLVAMLSLAPALACGGRVGDARPQWVVTLHTDAPVPQFGDRILVEALDATGSPACTGCRRLFGARQPTDWPFSFGMPDNGAVRQLRVRMYRSDHSDAGGEPNGDLTIDHLVTLPATSDVTDVDIVLSLDCAGIAADLAGRRTCVAGALVSETAGPLTAPSPRPGSAATAASVPCPSAAPADTVCIPGGLYARGTIMRLNLGGSPTSPERLVRVSPFALDTHEMTVAKMRELVKSASVPEPELAGDSTVKVCNYSREPGEKDDHPVNCVDRTTAAAACAARGMRLPTEAEWEYAAGNRDRETTYPWGEDSDVCSYAAVARGRLIPIESSIAYELSFACRPTGTGNLPYGTQPVASGADITDLGVFDLGGNVSEWVADAFDEYSGPCSQGPHVLVDPRCETSPRGLVVSRGGAWTEYPAGAVITSRSGGEDAARSATGFRCAKSL